MEGQKEQKPKIKFSVEHFRQIAALRPYQSILEVHDKDEDYVYRLVEDTPEAIRYREALGYEVVTEGPESVGGSRGQPDRRRRIAGELILMKRPQEIHQMDLQARKERAHQKMMGPMESFKGKAQRYGVEVVDETKLEVSPLASAASMGDDED